MVSVGRTAAGSTHKNKVVIRTVKLLFQRFPGVGGTDADRGIANVDYTLKIDGKVAAKTKTAADGGATLNIPSGSTAVLEIFDTKYTIKVVTTLEAVATKKGEQRRLQLLGYELGEVDGDPGAMTNFAVLDFQGDNPPLDTTGAIDAATRTQLTTRFGE